MDGGGAGGVKHLLADTEVMALRKREGRACCVDGAALSFTQVLSSLHVNACQSGFEETDSERRMEPADGFIPLPVWRPFSFFNARSSHSRSL